MEANDPKIADLIAELPEDLRGSAEEQAGLERMLEGLTHRPAPTGRMLRMWCLGSLQAKLAAAYGLAWLRGSFTGTERKAELKNEAHYRGALRTLAGMGYMRGAMTKLGQVMSSYPQVTPEQYVETLRALHFEAPPMHFSLLREYLRGELGADPEDVFAEFDRSALAAASLGQVHRARLKTGEEVIVKIQYPGIAKTIHGDFANLRMLLAPMRLMRDWAATMAQLEEIERVLTLETDYAAELANAEAVRAELSALEDVVVPRMHPEHSTPHVLTMEYLPGVHVHELMRTRPSQALRNRHAAQIFRVTSRLFHAGRMLAADPNPGNFLFLPDGRLGLIDFGCLRRLDPDEQEIVTLGYANHQDSEEAARALLQRCHLLSEAEMADTERIRILREVHAWYWRPLTINGDFDFSDPEHLRQGFESSWSLLRRRYHKALPVLTWMNRTFCGARAMAYLLRAKVNLAQIDREELERA